MRARHEMYFNIAVNIRANHDLKVYDTIHILLLFAIYNNNLQVRNSFKNSSTIVWTGYLESNDVHMQAN